MKNHITILLVFFLSFIQLIQGLGLLLLKEYTQADIHLIIAVIGLSVAAALSALAREVDDMRARLDKESVSPTT